MENTTKPFSDINLILRNYVPKESDKYVYAMLCNVIDAENNNAGALFNSEISQDEAEANAEVLRPLRVFLKSRLIKK